MAWYRCGMNGTYNATTVSRSGAVCNYVSNVGGVPLSRFIANITPIQEGSGDPSPINQRPITGRSAVNVARTGVNLADFTDGYGIATNGSIIVKEGRFATINPIPINPNVSYYTQSSMSGLSFIISVYKGTTLVRRTAGISVGTLLDTSGGDKLYVCGYRSTDVTIADCNPMVKATTDTLAYAPYTGQTATINLGGTYYGFKHNVGTGVLTVTHGMVDLGSLNWISEDITASGLARVNLNNVIPPLGAKFNQTPLCTQFKGISTGNYRSFDFNDIGFSNSEAYPFLRARTSNFIGKTDEEITALMNGVELVYELATPVEYQLTPAQLTQLLGENNVWADSGDSEVDFFKIIRT